MPYWRRKDGVVTWGNVVPERGLEYHRDQAIAFEAARRKHPPEYPRHETNAEMVERVKQENQRDLAKLTPLDETPSDVPDAPEVPPPPSMPVDFGDTDQFPTKATLMTYGEHVGVALDSSMTRTEMEEVLKESTGSDI